MSDLPPATIIIPNYNGRDLLARNLPAVCRAARQYPSTCHVIVVDDASPEQGVESTTAAFPMVRLLRHAVNKGFGEAIRTGVEAAETELLVFLNSDVEPREDFLAPLARALDDPTVFAVSPLIRHEDGSPYKESWNRRRMVGCRLRDVPWDLEQALGRRGGGLLPTLFTSGGSMAVRRSYFLALGGFAPIFKPFYVEDLDLGVQAWRHGWRVLFEPNSEVVHQEHGSISTNVRRARIKRAQRRNKLLFEWAHYSRRRLLLCRAPSSLLQLAGRALRGDWVYVSGFFAALRDVHQAAQHRRHVRSLSSMDFEAVLSLIDN